MLIGGLGYIGSLIHSIDDDRFDFKILDIKTENNSQYLDIKNKELLNQAISEFNPEIIINLAARTDLKGANVEDYSENWIGISNIKDIIKDKRIWLVHFSTMLVCKLGYELEHEYDYCPDTVYGTSKVKSELILRNSKLDYWTIIRPTTVWGNGAKFPYSLFIKIVKIFGFFELDIFSAKRDFCHEANAKILMHNLLLNILNNESSVNKKVFYLTDKDSSSINDIARKSANIYGGRTYKLPTFLNRLLSVLLYILALCGDFFENMFKISFVLNSRRLKNMQTTSGLDKSMNSLTTEKNHEK